MPKEKTHTASAALAELQEVIDTLIGPNGCPWDKEQTPTSLCDYLAEETFELIEGIRANDTHEAMEEMGDVLFLLLFMATLYNRDKAFSLEESLRYSAAKMIRRHPHVFGDKQIEDINQLWDTWESIKREENKNKEKQGVFDSLPKGLPPLLRAYRINSKAARNKFTWESDEAVEAKLREEWDEWQQAMAQGDEAASEQEFGDYLFTLVELGRRKGIKANAAIDFANQKFLNRFTAMEELAEKRGQNISDMDLDQMNALWDEIKD
ncbi:nucleoside triphosphate pyrophosphohydrolase [Pseudodesulfovibrio senegalensis]|uniref:Nucleoside triphosphate pyrophosphohydrolase n=1 Tax=Pseudodesulfovibrio senegalensis TaxID=1721087 RepID=A0A6N6N045_9BACT|nr:nucleoside triphosphate pyrophosphohydrolase [Pseudodesulfovibrio senegalensis]KAB1440282.1 nucleoside triphosphate pyrophosphohydrolase [Pseudodesulfovibrio senegalensis]